MEFACDFVPKLSNEHVGPAIVVHSKWSTGVLILLKDFLPNHCDRLIGFNFLFMTIHCHICKTDCVTFCNGIRTS